jgi:Icc-related predicted phosphoesterase
LKIDFLSDIHLESRMVKNPSNKNIIEYFSDFLDFNIKTPSQDLIDYHTKNFGILNRKNKPRQYREKFICFPFLKRDVLIVAGDISEDVGTAVAFFKILKKYFYKEILITFGNHDYYIHPYQERDYGKSSFIKIRHYRVALKNIGIKILDGTVYNINGINIGGAMGWYDGSYYPKNGLQRDQDYIDRLWYEYMPDSRFLMGVKEYNKIFEFEKSKIEAVYEKCDIMVTHVPPLNEKKYIIEKFKSSDTNVFYSFDGDKYIKNGNMKFWLYGHVHSKNDFIVHNKKVMSNPVGYRGENIINKVRTIVI